MLQSGGIMKHKQYALILCIYLCAASVALATNNFPVAPDQQMTPGDLCQVPNALRYPEKISYCDRNVDKNEKWLVIQNYMKKYNFMIDETNRTEFKIDHYIPLCMGGANSVANLWPQHQSVYLISDPLEVVLCEKLAEGKMTQHAAIEKIKQGKLDYKNIPALILEIKKIQ